MTYDRRQILKSTIAAAATGLLTLPAKAQDYPAGDIHFVCAFPPGGGADILTRYFAEKLRVAANRTVVVENRPGATGNIATEYVARAKPDGYTILVHAGSGIAANAALYKNSLVDASSALQVVATLNRQAYMLVVDARKPWKTVGELTAFLKEKGDKATYASVAVTARIMGALYRDAAGLKAVEVQYKSTLSSLNDMTGGAIDFAWHDPTFAMSQAREGRVRILAVASGTRIDTMPEIPTMAENGVPANLVGWFAAMVPAKTPKPVVDQLNVWLSEIVRRPETKKFLNDSGSDAWATMPEEGQKFFQQQLVDWKRYIEQAKIEQDG